MNGPLRPPAPLGQKAPMQVGKPNAPAVPSPRLPNRAVPLGRGAKGALVAAGVGAGAFLNRDGVRKQLYTRERRTHPVRATEAAVGVTMVGYGASRSGLVRDRIGRGLKGSNKDAWASLERARSATEEHTGNLTRALGRTTHGRKIKSAIPRGIRPTVAGALGGLMIGHAMPVRTTHYKPAGW